MSTQTHTGGRLASVFRVLFTPSCWLQNYVYCREWDQRINALMAKHKFKRRTEYCATLGAVKFWVGNHPYASFTPYDEPKVRPSRATILRAMDKLSAERL